MSETGAGFESLPPEYQQVIQLAAERHKLSITPLQQLAGGWSGAAIYLVSATSQDSGRVEHLVLKLDRLRPKASSDEISRHQSIRQISPPDFVARHIPELVYGRVEADNALAIFYSIAGQSLLDYRPLSKFRRQGQLEILFAATHHVLLEEWNTELAFEQVGHPQTLLKRWLGFRLEAGQSIERFLEGECQIDPDTAGLIIRGQIFPNPLPYARSPENWGTVRPGDAMAGLQHGDLNTNNILAKFSTQGDALEGYYLIDFALFKEGMPLLFDQRYLEMSYLVHALSQGTLAGVIDLVTWLSEQRTPGRQEAPVQMAGAHAVIRAGRTAFEGWVTEKHPSLYDDLWGQYWLAGAAAGLAYCHKAGLSHESRLAGLVYAAANLKGYLNLFRLPLPAEATMLYVEGQSGPRPAVRSALRTRTPGKRHNLPAPPTNFIGRATELSDLGRLLLHPELRLVTLTGPGGTGKTRLGLEAGRAMLEHFPGGVYFINLASLRDPALFATTTAHTLGIREGGGRPPLETLKDFLAAKQMLLLLDNFEQIREAAPVVAELLAAAPSIKALVTSRIPLQLRGEQEYPVSPLATPPDGRQSLETILDYEAIALFRQQARSVKPDFEVTEKNRAAVIEICRRLDGLPLAIEIAAARIRMLPPQALLKRLDRSLQLLVGGPKDLPDRQQTLRGTIDWSYNLLEPEVQLLFSRLGIFAGGFSLLAAEAVCNPGGDTDVFSGVESLVNSSLLRQVVSVSDEPRFDMLQTLREYALERIAEAGELAEMYWAHCRYFAQLASGEMGDGIFGADSVMWLRRFQEEHDNFRVALRWVLEQPEEGIYLAISMLTPLLWFWYRYGHLQEGSEWMERALAATEGMENTPVRSLALVGRANLAMWSGDLIVAAEHGKKAIEIAGRLGFDQALSFGKLGYGTTLINQGRDKEAYPHLVDAVELYDQQNQPWMKGTTLVHLANVSLGLGERKQALKWLDMAMPFMEASGDPWNMAFAMNNYGEVARAQGDYETAERYYRQTEAYYAQADARGDQARLVHTLGYIAQHKGKYAEARELFMKSLADFRELGNHRGIAECLAGLAGLAAERGIHRWAVPLLSAAESQLEAFGGAWWPADRVEVERARALLQAALEDEFGALWAQGQAMGVEEAIDYALKGQQSG